MQGKRITKYDVQVTAPAGQGASLDSFIQALRKAGLRAWKVGIRAYQVSFAEHPTMRQELPPIGTVYPIGRSSTTHK